MSFSFKVSGHAGTGMAGNSQEEIDAVRAVAAAALAAADEHNLSLTLHSFSPSEWAPEETQVQH